jgi:regulatory protein
MRNSPERGAHARRTRGPARIKAVEFDAESLKEPLVVNELSALPGRSDRWQVAVGGVTLGSVTVDFLADSGIREGSQLSAQQANDVVLAVNRTAVLDKALDLLAVRSRSARDLSIRLRRAGAGTADLSWTIARLEAQGFVDDASYARQVARAKALACGVSRRRVITTLRQRGVAADVAEEAIDSTLADVDIDEYGSALAAAQKRMRALRSLDATKRRQRLYAYLARRGYESSVVRRVLTEVLDRSADDHQF